MTTFPVRAFLRLVFAALFVFAVPRLPAPIQEITETPKPKTQTPRQKPKPAVTQPQSSAEPKKLETARSRGGPISGTWAGSVATAAGNFETTLVINPAGNAVTETNSFGTATHSATWDGKSGKWRSGPNNIYSWTFTPNPDGKTASTIVTGPYLTNPLTVFRRTAP